MSKRLSRAAGCTAAGGSGGFGAKKRFMKSNSNTSATVKHRSDSRKPGLAATFAAVISQPYGVSLIR
jgi:hypothetical protein